MVAKKSDAAMTFNILIKEEGTTYVAHCLELDIVATHDDLSQVQRDIVDLIETQVDYAFANDNLDHLYHPAPTAVWKDFYTCKEQLEERHKIKSSFGNRKLPAAFIPPWIIARTCRMPQHRHA